MRVLPIRLERRLGRLHIRFYGLYKWRIAPALAVFLGFGISYMPANAKWRYFGDSVELEYKIPKQVVQERLNDFIRIIKRTRSLEIRTHDLLDYADIENLRILRHLSITGPISKEIDLSRSRSLRTLAGNSSTMNRIHGLSELPFLREVYVNRVTAAWLRTLPISVKYLFFTGPLPENLDLAGLSNLRALGISEIKSLDLSAISSKPLEVNELVLSQIKHIDKLEQLPNFLPKLQTITLEYAAKSVRMEMSKRFAEKYKIIEKY